MKIVADTNIFLAAALNEPEKNAIISLTNGQELIAPYILPFEIGNALSALIKRGRLSGREVIAVYDEIQKIPVEMCAIDIKKALAIACQYSIYAYDAYFLECALAVRCPILTLDVTMKNIAAQLGIALLEVEK